MPKRRTYNQSDAPYRTVGIPPFRRLAAGGSVAAIEYRLVPEYPLPTAHHDSLQALQFIRSKATEWNIDKKHTGPFGGSAGAQICMWLAFHDEMADRRAAIR